MSLAHIPINQITEDNLISLVENKNPERKVLEYKERFHDLGNVKSKTEFLADLSSFANGEGGDIVYGMSDTGKGIPRELTGILKPNSGDHHSKEEVIEFRDRAEAVHQSGISPRLPYVQFQEVVLPSRQGAFALVVRVGRSYHLPHMVVFNEVSCCYIRDNKGKHRMDVGELRHAFGHSSGLFERIKKFREERLELIRHDHGPYRMTRRPILVFHIVPLSFVDPGQRPKFPDEKTMLERFKPLYESGVEGRYNLDGYVTHSVIQTGRTVFGYTQLFRSGALEVTDGILVGTDDSKELKPYEYERYLINRFPEWISGLTSLGVRSPFVIMLSFIDVNGYDMPASPEAREMSKLTGTELKRADRDDILVPDEIFDFEEENRTHDWQSDRSLKRIFDTVWQAVGYEGDEYYDLTSGKWAGPKRR